MLTVMVRIHYALPSYVRLSRYVSLGEFISDNEFCSEYLKFVLSFCARPSESQLSIILGVDPVRACFDGP